MKEEGRGERRKSATISFDDSALNKSIVTTPRRAKIVCTLGPATRSEEMISRLIGAGADVIRLNFSHGLHEEHGAAIRHIRRISEKKGSRSPSFKTFRGRRFASAP